MKLAIASKYYHPIIHSRKRYIVMYGGRSSAKSHTAAQKMALMCRTEENFKGVMVRQVHNTIKDSQWSKIKSVIYEYGWENEFHITKSPLEITHIPTGNTIIARGLDDAAKLKSLDDPTVMWIEEALEISEDSFIKIDTSIRSSKPGALKQMIITFNPEDENHFLNRRFFPPNKMYEETHGDFTYIQSPEPDTVLFHSTYKHNDFLCEDDTNTIKQIERACGVDSNYYKVYVLGLWGNALKGLVFEDVEYVAEFPSKEDCKHYGYGLDFGFTNDPTAIVRCALTHGQIYLEELTYKTGLVNCGDYSIVEEFRKHGIKDELIVADSAEPKSITELCREHYRVVGVKKGKDSIEAGINLMKQYKINIVGDSPNLKKELKSYKYKENKEGSQTEFSNKPVDEWNHLIDASRYWCWHNLKKNEFYIA